VTFKRLCPLCNVTHTENLVTVCARCAGEHHDLHSLYIQILRARPHLRTLGMVEVFGKLWERFQQLEK
jgi:hypothetical protein